MVKSSLASFVVGIVFSAGLCLSHMVDPAVVVGFLDVSGRWDPRLLLVMAGAVAVNMVTFPLIMRYCRRPVCGASFHLPDKTNIDTKLVLGSVLFGIGWGLGGVCPGPAVSALAFGLKEAAVFFVAMIIGMGLHSRSSQQG